jgi:hypothetical protein
MGLLINAGISYTYIHEFDNLLKFFYYLSDAKIYPPPFPLFYFSFFEKIFLNNLFFSNTHNNNEY